MASPGLMTADDGSAIDEDYVRRVLGLPQTASTAIFPATPTATPTPSTPAQPTPTASPTPVNPSNVAATAAYLRNQTGGDAQLASTIGVNRGEAAGTPSPALAGYSPSDLAQLDRFTNGRLGGAQFAGSSLPMQLAGLLSTGVLATGSEAAKLGGNLGGRIASSVVGAVAGPQYGAQFMPSQYTSPPSFNNIQSWVTGYLNGLGGQGQ